MTKFLLFSIVGLLVITAITARSTDGQLSCGQHGDLCSQGCCDGFSCNSAAGRCMAIITENTLKDARSKLKHVQSSSLIDNSQSGNQQSCGVHGDSCAQGCCNGFSCNTYAGRCMATITEEALREARQNLKPVQAASLVQSSQSSSCGKHGDSCSQGCCNGFSCNAYAGKCMAKITEEALREARQNLKPVQASLVSSSQLSNQQSSCGKHGDSCAQGCCDGFNCNAYAGRCMATITADMLKEARSKLKPVLPRTQSNVVSQSNSQQTNCGVHGDSCAQGCCNGYTCNAAAGRCMATITADMLKEARANLKHVNSAAVGA